MTVATAWLRRRLYPLLATVGLIAYGMSSSTWWGPHFAGSSAWLLPHDLWGTLVAARRLLHLDLGGLYTSPTGLVSFPGAAVILVPAAAVIDAAGLSLRIPGPHNPQPAAWLIAGPYQIALSAAALFAADALAERLGVAWPRRMLLAAASAVALWSVSVQWGHPEDAVAVALLLYAILALSDGRAGRSAWLAGVAIAVQPLVLLALPFILVVLEPRRLAPYLARAAALPVLAVGAAAAANWHATFTAMTSQPNWPSIDHRTPWTPLATHLSGGAVAAGPARLIAIIVACGCAYAVGRRWHAEPVLFPWDPQRLTAVLWWSALALALRCVFEPVMVAYYIWPALAVALIAAAASWWQLTAAGIVAGTLTKVSQFDWRGPWIWWATMVTGLAVTLLIARFRWPANAAGQPPSLPQVQARAGDLG